MINSFTCFRSSENAIFSSRLKTSFFVLFFSFMSLMAFAQTNISGVINSYVNVTAISQPACVTCLPCVNTITVSDGSLFSVGETAVIIQMRGATINTTNTNAGGQITAIGNAGNYEFFEIETIVGNVLTPRYPLIKTYNTTGQVQVIKVPNYPSGANVTGTLTSVDWNEATGRGGVLALRTTTLTLNANIDVVARGFRGVQMGLNGLPDGCTIDPTTAFTLNNTVNYSFTKGNGIVIEDINTNRGRASRANGGGSGISGDSGGGGGSSFGFGGEGGKRWCDINGLSAGGLGGVSLASYQSLNKLFLGGAGGAGFVTTNNPSSPSDGGGIVIILADQIVGNGFTINASGTNGAAVNPVGAPDGGGGGGGGGSVAIKANTYTGNLFVRIDGGEGQDLNTNNVHGPGGGGGGGVFLYSTQTLPANVFINATGGQGGEHTVAPQIGQRNGSQDGAPGGSFSLYTPPQNPDYLYNDLDGVGLACDLDDDNDGVLDTVENGALPDPIADTDGDATLNFMDSNQPGYIDVNGDLVDDRYDTDLDGIINQLDADSDGDGCSDSNEFYNSAFADGNDNGTYGVGTPAVNPNGTVTAASYAGSYTNVTSAGTASTITTQPADQSVNGGGNATFNVVATGGSGTTNYQWQESTNNGSSWTNITNGGVYSGATTNALSITGATVSMVGYDYRVVLTQSNFICANVISSSANLCVINIPTVSSTTQPTCAVTTGTIVFTTQTGVEYSIDNGTTYQASPTFAGLAPGTYTLRVRSTTDTTCSTQAAATVTINAVPTAPTAPTVSSTTQPTCAVTTGTIVFTTQAGVEYSIDNGATYQASPTFSGLAPGTYTLRVRSTTDTTCSTQAASTVTINAVPTAPSTPTVSSTTQPTCAVTTGTIVFTTQAGVEYSIDNGATYQASPTFSGLAPGTYTLRVRSTTDTTCSTQAASTVTINAVPTIPATPTASVTVQPLCVLTGTIVVSAPSEGSGFEYSIDGGVFQASSTFTNVSSGSHSVVVRRVSDFTCQSAATILIVTDWAAVDCDGDGNLNGTDPNPTVPTATDDVVSAPFGGATTVNILTNDDYLANDGNTITQTGGTAGGVVSFDPVTGLMSYTPLATEAGTSVTVTYQVCQGAICDTATVTITVPQGDLDGDGNPDSTDPNPTVPTATDDVVSAPFGGATTVNILTNDDYLANDGNTITQTGGTAGGVVSFDPVTGLMSYTPLATEAGTTVTVVYQVCQPGTPNVCDTATVTITVPQGDLDGDGNPDSTDPNPTVPTANNDTVSAPFGGATTVNILTNDDYLANDGNTITQTGGTAGGVVSFDPVTGLMSYTPLATEAGTTVTVVYQVCQPGTPNVCDTATVTITVPQGDLDGDGNPDSTDPNPTVPTATDDVVSAPFGGATTVNILTNDDYLANDGNTITQTGGTAGGVVSFDPVTGLMSYTPLATEAGTTVTVVYQVCQPGTPNVCNTATVTITVPVGDLDGDGNPDNTDPNPTDPCIYGDMQVLANATPAWLALDCDGDGNPNGTDPNVLTPVATDDDATAVFGSQTTINILDNDDFLSNNGNTITQVGGTAQGTVSFDPTTGTMTYTPLASETGSTVTVIYQVCQGTVCTTATVTITVPETELVIYNAISANGDDINNHFHIEGIEAYPNNTVEIYNRWGVLVYEARRYDNTSKVFVGQSEGRVTIKQDSNLPNGVYYYVLRYVKNDGKAIEKVGYLYLN